MSQESDLKSSSQKSQDLAQVQKSLLSLVNPKSLIQKPLNQSPSSLTPKPAAAKLSNLLTNYTSFNGTDFGIFLKGLHINKIMENFRQNKYSNFDIRKFKENIRKKYPLLPDFYQTRLIEKKELVSFVFSEKDNTKHKFFVLDEEPELCNWCREPISGIPIGIPLQLYFTEGCYTVFFESTFYCCFECCYSGVKSISFDETYSNSEYILKFLFYLTTKGHDLREAPDWRIMKKNTLMNNNMNKTFLKKIGYVETRILSPIFSVKQDQK